MKRKILKRVLLISVGLVILSISVLTAFAATETTPDPGCPEETGGYEYQGNRSTEYCYQSKTEVGYWWLSQMGWNCICINERRIPERRKDNHL